MLGEEGSKKKTEKKWPVEGKRVFVQRRATTPGEG